MICRWACGTLVGVEGWDGKMHELCACVVVGFLAPFFSLVIALRSFRGRGYVRLAHRSGCRGGSGGHCGEAGKTGTDLCYPSSEC